MDGNDWGTIDAVIHMGACSATTSTDNDYLYDNNFVYSTQVAEFALRHNARFVYASSAATYGSGNKGFFDTERDLRPLNMYAYSKHLFDEWIRDNHLDTECVGLKFFNVFGANEYHKGKQASMVWKAYTQLKTTGKIQLFMSDTPDVAHGNQTRDFVYVRDAVSVVLTLVANKEINGIINLGSGIANTWNHLAEAVCMAANVPAAIEYIPMPESLAGQYQNHTCADLTTFRAKMPGTAFYTLEAAVNEYVTQYLATSWPYR